MSKNLNYGVIGNCTTAALVSEKGFIEWLCFPYFDSPSVFAAILDEAKGGHFGFEVSSKYKITQSYIPHTNILSTEYDAGNDAFAVMDFMPCYHLPDGQESHRPSEIYRYIRRIKGKPQFRVIYRPAPDYARGETVMRQTASFIESYSTTSDRFRQYLYSSLPLPEVIASRTFTLEKDEFFLLSGNEKVIQVDMEREKLEYCRTLVYWLNWTSQTEKYARYADVIERSMLALKLMTFHNGAVLAALTTSIPEEAGGVRNWDYRFCWLRDASMSIETLFNTGHTNAARKFMKFILHCFSTDHNNFQIMYGIHGERILTEITLEHLTGYKASRPVRIGNDAYHQRQNDSFGYLMDVIYQYYRLMPGPLNEVENMWEMVRNIMQTVTDDWHKPDKGIWEIRGKEKNFVSSKVMCWVAMDRGSKIAEMLGKEEYAQRWKAEAGNIHKDVMAKGWKEEIQSFSQAYENTELDSSLLLMEMYGFIQADDDRFHKTVKAVRKELLHNGLMYRYTAHDDFGYPSSAFTICTFWLIRALWVIGEKEEAKILFTQVLKYTNHVGLLSEDIHFETKELLGNFPQAYSHLAIINTAILLSESTSCLPEYPEPRIGVHG